MGIDHEWKHIDILNCETQTPEFKAMNMNAQIPVLQINEHEYLSESNQGVRTLEIL